MKFIEFLSQIKKRPGMYISDEFGIRDLEQMFFGYQAAVNLNTIEEDINNFNSEFREYVYKKYKWSTCRGWSEAISANAATTGEALELFFKMANEYIRERYNINNAINENNVP